MTCSPTSWEGDRTDLRGLSIPLQNGCIEIGHLSYSSRERHSSLTRDRPPRSRKRHLLHRLCGCRAFLNRRPFDPNSLCSSVSSKEQAQLRQPGAVTSEDTLTLCLIFFFSTSPCLSVQIPFLFSSSTCFLPSLRPRFPQHGGSRTRRVPNTVLGRTCLFPAVSVLGLGEQPEVCQSEHGWRR